MSENPAPELWLGPAPARAACRCGRRLALLLALVAAGCTPPTQPPPHAGTGTADSGARSNARPEPAASATSAPTSSPAAASAARPNILFILTDDQAPDTLGVEGNRTIRTPHLDRLAREGVRFSRAYVAIPQCAPSRAAILTGRYPHQTGVLDNDEAQLPPDAQTLAQMLKQAGYRCGLVGKWHLGNPTRSQAGFDDWWVALDTAATPRTHKYLRPIVVWNGEPRQHEQYLTEVDADAAIQFMDQADERPFFLWLAFHAPHTPVTAHRDFRYSPTDIGEPPSMPADLAAKPAAPLKLLRKRFQQMGWPAVQKEKAAYYSMISAVDAAVGRIVEHLRATGRDRDTLVVFSSDNGWFLGEHGLYSKGATFREPQARTPLIFWQPGSVPAGRTLDVPVSSLDYFPTLAGRAGAPGPAGLAGCDLWPVISGAKDVVSGPDGVVRECVFLEYMRKPGTDDHPMLGAVTSRFKLARYLATGEEEFYDLAADPLEMNNLATSAEPPPELAALRARLDAFQAGIRPPFWE